MVGELQLINTHLGNAIASMYSKCGNMELALAAFNKMPVKDEVSFNVMIAAFAQNETGRCMAEQSDFHDHFVGLQPRWTFEPSVEYFVCILDLLGRGDRVADAEEIIDIMPFEPDYVALLFIDLLSSSTAGVQQARPTKAGPVDCFVLSSKTSGAEEQLKNFEAAQLVETLTPAGEMGKTSSDEHTSKPHVVALAFLTQGHINPLKRFCLQLAANGVQVTFVAISHEKFFSTSQQQQQLHIPPQEHVDGFSVEQLVLKAPPSASYAQLWEAIYNLEAPFEELVRRLEPEVCCIISDCMYSWTQAIAKRLGVPRAGFWTAALASLDVDYHVPLLKSNGSIPVTELNKDSIVSYLPGLPPLRASELPFIYHADNEMTITDPGYVRKIERSVILKDDAWVIANSFEDFEPNVFEALTEVMNSNCIGVGPLLPLKFLESPEKGDEHSRNQDVDCLKWLNTKAPMSVLYISFGSAVTMTSEEFKELSEGIEASQQTFLWALRPGGVLNLCEEALESFKERNKPKGMVISWAPQIEILSHDSTGAFVTHCGWNSVLEGICGGVPMLGWPKHAEQNLNCKLLEEAGAGYSLLDKNFHPLKRDAIATKIRSILADHEMQQTAKRLRSSARRTVDSSQANLEEFVNYLRNLKNETS